MLKHSEQNSNALETVCNILALSQWVLRRQTSLKLSLENVKM